MKQNSAVTFSKTLVTPSTFSPQVEEMAGARGQHAASLFHPRPVGSSRGEGHGQLTKDILRALGLTIGAAAAVWLAGCTVGPNYSRPVVATPTAWKEGAVATNATVLPTAWWTIFNDSELDALEVQAVTANQDLKRAVARVTEARAIARVTKADRYPNIFAGSAYTKRRESENRDLVMPKTETEDFSASFDMSFEVDAWGRIRRNFEASKADLAATKADLQVVLLTLTADVARNYQQLRSLDNEKAVIEATIALRKDAVQLQQTRAKGGLNNEMDLTRARTELANVEAELHAVLRSRAQTEHALAVLCGQAPADFAVAAKKTIVVPPQVPVGLPASLLERRPDVVGAEHTLEAANARIGVAKAAFFPTIKLTGEAGYASADLGTLVDWPSRFAQFGPSISVPVFQGGRNKANLKAAEARYEQNVATYRGSVLNAFREVEDSLSDLSALARQGEAVNRALVSARDTTALANERYQKGLSSYLDVVDAQRAVLQAERQEVQLNGQRTASTILLAKALGGGW